VLTKGQLANLDRNARKYLIYLPKNTAEDSMFPFPPKSSREVKISFTPGEKKLTIEPLE
jgi:hypothetical protein